LHHSSVQENIFLGADNVTTSRNVKGERVNNRYPILMLASLSGSREEGRILHSRLIYLMHIKPTTSFPLNPKQSRHISTPPKLFHKGLPNSKQPKQKICSLVIITSTLPQALDSCVFHLSLVLKVLDCGLEARGTGIGDGENSLEV
jgi:hypothetical protein